MNKMFGMKSDFAYLKEDASRIVVGYDYKEIDDSHAEWFEIYFYKAQIAKPTLEQIKEAIDADIDSQTDEKILNGYQWTILHGEDQGNVVKVWLSKENQNNFKAKHDVAKEYPNLVTWPMKYKVSEDAETKRPIYEYFDNMEELVQFYIGGLNYIETTYNAGWDRKDGIDMEAYEEALAELFPEPANAE